MATATLITIPVYAINGQVQDRSLFPFGNQMAFGAAAIQVQPNSFQTLNDLQAGRQAGAALIYSRVKSSATGDTVFYSNLTVAAIVALGNA